jgi:Zn-dependent peptidase ImmA (M78 family)
MPGLEENHIRAVAQATKLLEHYGIIQPEDIRLEDVAWDLGIEIETQRIAGAKAFLNRNGSAGIITLSDKISTEGERRFAVSHELGHWQLHSRLSQVFYCSEKDLQEYRNGGPELEANTFASELLIPRFMLSSKLISAEPSWEIIKELSLRFNVSLTAAAVRYADISRQSVVVVFSQGGQVTWWRRNERRHIRLWLESRQTVAEDSVMFDVATRGIPTTSLQQVPWESWFPDINGHNDGELFEASGPVDEEGTLMSLLWAPGI